MKKDQDEHQKIRSGTITGNTNRKLVRRRNSPEISAPLAGNAESKLPQLNDDSSSKPVPVSSSISNVPFAAKGGQHTEIQRKIIHIPTDTVGLVLGIKGKTIKNFMYESGAIIKMVSHDPYTLETETEVHLWGTSKQISKAEKLINDLIEQEERVKVPPGAEETIIKFPNGKVGLLIGFGFRTRRYIQASSGARIQVIPEQLRPGDPSRERNILIKGHKDQIKSAKKLLDKVIDGTLFRSNKNIEPANRTRGYRHSPGPSQVHQQQPHYRNKQPRHNSYFNKPSSPVAGRYRLNQSSTSPQRSSRKQSYSSGYRERSASFSRRPRRYSRSPSDPIRRYSRRKSGPIPAHDQQSSYFTSAYRDHPTQDRVHVSQTSQKCYAYPRSPSPPMAKRHRRW